MGSGNRNRPGAIPHGADGVTSRAATVNARRAVKIEDSVTVLRRPEELYRFWRDFSNLPLFMRHLVSVHCTDDQHSHWVARTPGGKTVEWDAVIVNDVPNQIIAWKTVGDSDVAQAGSVHFRSAPGDRGTEVRIAIDYELPGARIMSSIAKLFGHAPDALLQEDMQRFKEYMESGEVPATEGQSSCR